MDILNIKTNKREQLIDITSPIESLISEKGYQSGILLVYSPHTTAGITINENADPSVTRDIENFLNKTIPQNYGFSHAEGNSDAHIKGSLVNFSQMFIIENGALQLGTWQGIYFAEFDGPRNRKVWVQFLSLSTSN